MIGCRGEPPIGALPQWRIRGMKLNTLIRHAVRRADSRSAGIVVVKFPSGQRAIARDAALDIDDPSGAKVSPGEFFFSRPNYFHRMTCRPGQSCRFQRGVAGVLAAVSGTS